MKHKNLLSILVASSLMIVGCAFNGGESAPNISLEEFKNAISEGILGTQNYSANIRARYKGEKEDFHAFNIYSINDDAIFDDNDTYFYNGYIRQKGQGIVDFQMLKGGSAVVPGEFWATDPNIAMHDFYPAAPSNVFADLSAYTKVKNNVFKSENIDQMAVIANLGMGIYAMRVMNPESFTVSINKDYSKVVVKAEFIDNYQSEEAGSLDDTFVQIPVYITLTYTKIGSTSFPSIENYIENPDEIYPTPTGWSEADLAILKNHFNDTVPPYPTGLSYAYEVKSKGYGNNYYALVIDYASGDLTSSYGATLTDFSAVSESLYRKVVDDTAAGAKYTYEIEMTFYDPEDVMDPETGEKWGYCYPNGVFQIKYSYKMSLITEINTLLDLVSYFDIVDVNNFFMFDDVSSAAKVQNFSDGTVVANQSAEEDIYHFVAPTGYANFKIKFTYQDAVKFGTAQEGYLSSCSDLSRSTFTDAHSVSYSSDDTITVFQFTLMSSFNESTYPGYVEIRVRISNSFYEAHKNDQTDKIRINYKVLNQNGEDVTSDALDNSSNLPLRANKSSTVNLSTVLNNGYTFVQYEPSEPEESAKTVAAQITSGTFVSTNAISSFVAPAYDFTLVIRVNELDPAIGRLTSISVEDVTTEYKIGDSYSFDGRVIAHYTTGDVDVTSEATITGTVNTSVEDRYDLTVSYTDENGQSASVVVKIYVRAATTYKINVKPISGVTIQVTYPVSGASEATYEVMFTVTEGESLLHDIKVLTISGQEVSFDWTNDYRYVRGIKTYYFEMPAEEVVITPIKDVSEDTLAGSYSILVPLTTKGYYNKYTLTFNADGSTGSYTRTTHNSNPVDTTYTLYFSYTVKNGHITIKLEGFDTGVDNNSFMAGYRLFASSQMADEDNPHFENLNNTGVINDKYSVTFSLADRFGQIANTLVFYRE